MPTLLVASAGGHLQQLDELRGRLGARGVVWVTYPSAQAGLLAGDDPAVHAHHPTTKHPTNAIRNYRLARRVFADHRIERVVSTGAAVAVPFILRAWRLGIPCHYIESATRVEGPSLSGRMVAALRGVHCYRQLGDWGGPRWRQGPSVFDGFSVHERSGDVSPEAVVVTLGTHHFEFDALVERLATCFRGSAAADVLWQLGATRPPPGLPGRVVERLPRDELDAAIKRADVVVGHAGVGTALTAQRLGKVPVLVPRRRRRREHTDDHQVAFARELDRRGLAVTAEVNQLNTGHLRRAARLTATTIRPPPFDLVD